MYCVIQKIERKKPNTYGASKELIAESFSMTINGETQIKNTYRYSNELFERPIKTAYKISIHESYRENGTIKKKQWSICTMGYYDLVEFSLFDFADNRICTLSDEIGLSVEEIYDIIYKKLDPIIDEVEAEFKETEEYKAKTEQKAIISAYQETKKAFEDVYGPDTYDYCYDLYGNLQNEKQLEKLKSDKIAKDEYTNRSYQEYFKSNYSDYFNNNGSSYSINSSSNYNDDEKKILREIYRMASKKFHPDVSGDDGSKMKFLTKLKEQWGL
ncbi:hypothetical protein [Rummeliibacillus sp. POC4]|uniref:hypothetical protein n=1 Tax=Rummeliibacillus sp. POC4 TaxID=2305899 RepID=UPI000E660C57|nr:hypothetical protein [Rummeliibacillus sp. POC4]RIJ64163.1 hypothetical protein D1606_11600 [Rummeliibacillus sp. POC4]